MEYIMGGGISILISIVTTILTDIIIRYFNENLGKIHIYRKIITLKSEKNLVFMKMKEKLL